MSRASKKSVTLGGLRDQLDGIAEQLDRLEKLIRLLVPNETRTLPSQIVGMGKKPFLADLDRKNRSRIAPVASEQTPPLSLPSLKNGHPKQVTSCHAQ
jgi:hypothetical protein